MSDKALARRTEAQVVLNGVDISVYVNRDWLSFAYTDNEEDEADDLQIKVEDRDGKWLTKYLNSTIDSAAQGGQIINSISQTGASAGSDYPTYTVTAATGLNVRRGAGEKYKILGKLAYGTTVAVQEFYSSWAKITYSGSVGYIKGSSLRKNAGISSESGGTVSEAVQSAKGLKISAAIILCNGNGDGKDAMLDCGQFELDSISAQGPPATVTIKATSLSFSNPIRQTLKSKVWENCLLSAIARKIASENGMGLLFESKNDPAYTRIEQYQTSDIAFLQKLCHDAGCSLKSAGSILVIFDQAEYESKNTVRTIKYGADGGYIRYKIDSGTNSCYTSCRVYYTAPDGTTISATEYAENYNENSANQQCLEVCRKVSGIAEAQELAHKLLRLNNKYELTGTFTFPGDTSLAAGNTVELSGFGFGDGKYIIRTAKHSISASGYTTQITIRKCMTDNADAGTGTVSANDSDEDIYNLAMQVIRGEWDNGTARKERLTAAGHDYDAVQKKVNEILYG